MKFANERCWGTLSCSMMACPMSQRQITACPFALTEKGMQLFCPSSAASMQTPCISLEALEEALWRTRGC